MNLSVVVRDYLVKPENSTVRFAQMGPRPMVHLTQDGAQWNKALCGTTCLTGWNKLYGVREVRTYHVCKRCAAIAQSKHDFMVQSVEENY